jgi:hypothetical protein
VSLVSENNGSLLSVLHVVCPFCIGPGVDIITSAIKHHNPDVGARRAVPRLKADELDTRRP